MKKSALLPALALLGLSAVPSHANIILPVTVGPSFTATLTNFADGSFVNINAIGPSGTFSAGQFYFDGLAKQLSVSDLTGIDTLPGDTSFLVDPTYNILNEVDFANLTLTETFAGKPPMTVSLYGDPAALDTTTITNYLDTGTVFLFAPTVPAGSTLVSATLTGQFSDGFNALGKSQQLLVGAVPETNTGFLLLAGLALVALPVLSARVRAGRRSL